MIDPLVSAVIAIGILSCIGIWKISNKQCGAEHKKDKRKIGEVLLILGIGALALIFIGVGAGIKRRNSKQEE